MLLHILLLSAVRFKISYRLRLSGCPTNSSKRVLNQNCVPESPRVRKKIRLAFLYQCETRGIRHEFSHQE